jgi:hypothetical protein
MKAIPTNKTGKSKLQSILFLLSKKKKVSEHLVKQKVCEAFVASEFFYKFSGLNKSKSNDMLKIK